MLRYSDKTWRLMATSGLEMVYCGVESASPERLVQLNKGGTAHPDQALELARRSMAVGIVPEFSFMIELDVLQRLLRYRRPETAGF